MDPKNVPNFTDGESSYPVDIIINDFNGMAIGKVSIEDNSHYVVRWNYDEESIGFPQSRGKPAWFLLAKGIKLHIDI